MNKFESTRWVRAQIMENDVCAPHLDYSLCQSLPSVFLIMKNVFRLLATSVLLSGCAELWSTGNDSRYSIAGGAAGLEREEALVVMARELESESFAKSYGLDAPMRVIRSELPRFPRKTLAGKPVGKVVVRFSIAPSGNVENIHIVSSPDSTLSELVRDAMSKWQFMPFSMQGKLRSITLDLPFEFAKP